MIILMYVSSIIVTGFGTWVIRKGLTAKEASNVQWELKRGYI